MTSPTTKRPERTILTAESERRKIGKVVHDDRGNASVHFDDAPAHYQRTKLELQNEAGPRPSSEQGCNPYAQRGAGTTLRHAGTPPATRPRTDLRRLSEHIKQMRELQARKREEQD